MTCHQLIFEERCPFDPNEPGIWKAGDLNKFFERITTDSYYVDKFHPNILSRPETDEELLKKEEEDNADNKRKSYKKRKHKSPWIVTLNNFLSEEECDILIELGSLQGYERSEDVGHRNFDGTYGSIRSDGRTSSNSWCLEDCYKNATTQNVLQRIENLTAIPDSHSEYLQLLRYQVGEYYNEHHDFVVHHMQRPQGPRILTFFLYLNDVEEGGGTHFNNMDLTVMPSKGKAVIWPSVLDENPMKKEQWTHHEALPVLKGVKYGANAWVRGKKKDSIAVYLNKLCDYH